MSTNDIAGIETGGALRIVDQLLHTQVIVISVRRDGALNALHRVFQTVVDHVRDRTSHFVVDVRDTNAAEAAATSDQYTVYRFRFFSNCFTILQTSFLRNGKAKRRLRRSGVSLVPFWDDTILSHLLLHVIGKTVPIFCQFCATVLPNLCHPA